jgi:nucleoside-diphosphate kinase
MAEEFYTEHKGKPFYPGLVEFMTSGPIVALVLAKAGAIMAWRELMGPTDVFEARVRAPQT